MFFFFFLWGLCLDSMYAYASVCESIEITEVGESCLIPYLILLSSINTQHAVEKVVVLLAFSISRLNYTITDIFNITCY